MKKIAFALVALLVALSPLAAGESWIGVTTGPAFEIQVTDDLTDVGATDTTVTDFNWDINLEGAYYFDEAETIGIGARLGVGIYYGSTFEFKNETLMGLAAELGAGMIPEDTSAEQQMALLNKIVDSASYKSITGGTKIAPAITFQYRLALADNLDLRLGAGLQYIHTFGNGMKATVEIPGMGTKDQTTEANGVKHGEFLTDGFQMSITPRVGVSYAF